VGYRTVPQFGVELFMITTAASCCIDVLNSKPGVTQGVEGVEEGPTFLGRIVSDRNHRFLLYRCVDLQLGE
jgi:hypothetical protein